jgi:FAD/FMN-containing dehydrogenase
VPQGGWLLSTDRLTKLEIHPGCAVAGAGLLLRDLQSAARKTGQFYAPDPTEWSASVGGTIATNASGSRSFLYGPTRRHLLSLTVASLDGTLRTFHPGDPLDFDFTPIAPPLTTKNAAGLHSPAGATYLDLLCGSEGLLGVVVEAELALLPLPARLLAGVVFFPSEELALAAAESWRGVNLLRMLEYLDSGSLRVLRAAYPDLPPAAQAALMIEQIADDESEDAWLDRLESAQALEESWFGDSDPDRERFRAFRHKLPELVNDLVRRNGFQKLSTDCAVPLSANPAMMRWYADSLQSEFPGKYVIFGHIGDAHVHVNILPESDDDALRGRAFLECAARAAVSLGGTVSAEHGLGKKAHLLAIQFNPDEIAAMCAIKRRFDPHWLLGRGTLLPIPPDLD